MINDNETGNTTFQVRNEMRRFFGICWDLCEYKRIYYLYAGMNMHISCIHLNTSVVKGLSLSAKC